MKKLLLILVCILTLNTAFTQRYSMGAIFDKDVYNKGEKANLDALGFGESLPARYSYKMYAPLPGNQGQYGTCVGWSTIYGGMTVLEARNLGMTDPNRITALAFGPFYNFNQVTASEGGTCNGALIYNMASSLRTRGAVRNNIFEMGCEDVPKEKVRDYARNFRLGKFQRLVEWPEGYDGYTQKSLYSAPTQDKVTPVKKALNAGNVVVIGASVPTSFGYVPATGLWKPWTQEYDATNITDTLGGHAMLVVGYDDNLYGGVVEILNSWGPGWGNNGFVYVPYGDFNKFVVEAWMLEAFDDNVATTGCVYGNCEDGYGRYLFDNGAIYEGEFKDNQYNGEGIYVWPDGQWAYAGQWKDGKRHGGGHLMNSGAERFVYYDNDQEVTYKVDNNSTTATTGCIEGDCQNGIGTFKYSTGETYRGSFKNGKENGLGTITFTNNTVATSIFKDGAMETAARIDYRGGTTYLGQVSADMLHGVGLIGLPTGLVPTEHMYNVMISPSDDDAEDDGLSAPAIAETGLKNSHFMGVMKTGQFSDQTGSSGCQQGNCVNGYGVYRYDDGSTYEGYFKDGYRHHYGVYTFPNGNSYEGGWTRGVQDGLGVYRWASNDKFIGEYRRGKADGYGVEITADGSSYLPGIWEAGTYQQGKNVLGFSEAATMISEVEDIHRNSSDDKWKSAANRPIE